LEELTDVSLKVCENGRAAGQKHNSRGAALLTSNGKVYSGCDVYLKDRDPNGISAERSAVMAAVADGSSAFHCLVLSTDTMINFPVPDGQSREFLRSFGVFPVILVNCELNMKYVLI
jgi:cytidine deaminase